MKKKLLLLSLMVASLGYANEEAKETEIKLEETVVTSATGFETAAENIAATITVITQEEIEKNNYQTIVDALKEVPAVNIIGDPKNPVIDMRGFGDAADGNVHGRPGIQNVQILVDGIATNFSDTTYTNSSVVTVPIENVEQIEIIPGGGAILYGSGTAGGVINIITKKGTLKTGGHIASEIDSFGAKRGDVFYSTNIGDLGINLGYTRTDYKGYRDGDTLESDYFMGDFNYKIDDKQSLKFKYSRLDEKSTIPQSLTLEQAKNDPTSNGLSGELGDELSKRDTLKDDFLLNYKYEIKDKLMLDLMGYYTKTDLTTYSSNTFLWNGTMRTSTTEYDFFDKKYGFKPKLNYNYSDSGNLIVGFDHVNDNFIRDSILSAYYTDYTKTTNSVFALNTNNIGKFQIIEGVRYEHSHYEGMREQLIFNEMSRSNIDRTMSDIAYELSANYVYSDTGNAYLKGVHGFNTPAPSVLYNKIDGYYTPNDLESEEYDTIELGMKDNIFGSNISANIYYSEVTNDIEYMSFSSGGVYDNDIVITNIGKTRRYGAEITAEQYFGNITIREGYAYIDAKIVDAGELTPEYSGKDVAYVPKHKFNFAIDYQVTPEFNVILDTVYSSGYYTDNENTEERVNSKMVTSLTMNFEPVEDLKVYGGINNLFNEEYFNSIDGTYCDPAAERSLYLGFKYSF